ncbi:hypothetical protein TIFTF001_019261 [Ficus carica]|uniref:Uncharacterized protein n=1 Tax=Ficus carica TaxID=3494 RepID=A0AA88ABC0_FICCA|nr:hypothetical protein TIFTF001_019261 [Ficus carica]
MERGGVSSMAVTVRRVGGRTRSEGEKGGEAQKLDHEFGVEGGKGANGGKKGGPSCGVGGEWRQGDPVSGCEGKRRREEGGGGGRTAAGGWRKNRERE